MNNSLLHYYQEELVHIRKLLEEYAQKFPKIASRLRIGPHAIEDPEVARLVESFALLAAELHYKIEDDYPEIAQPLLENLCPHLLAPIPGFSVVQFVGDANKLTAEKIIPAKTELKIGNVGEKELYAMTCYPVHLLPIEIEQASIHARPLVAPPISNANVTAVLRMRLRCTNSKLMFAELNINKLFFYIQADLNYAYAVYELLFNHTVSIVVANGTNDQEPIILAASQLQALGFSADDGLLPYSMQTPEGSRLLTEFFNFPQKYLFFAVNNLQAAIVKKDIQQNQALEIYFYFNKANPVLEKCLNKDFFALGCAPVVNLFYKKSPPLELNNFVEEYRLEADTESSIKEIEIYSIEKLFIQKENEHIVECPPLHSLKTKPLSDVYYNAMRKPAWESGSYTETGTEMFLNFTNDKGELNVQNKSVVYADLLCANRDLPGQLLLQQDTIDFTFLEKNIEGIKNIRALLPFTPTEWPILKRNMIWKFISHLAFEPLIFEEIAAFQAVLQLYDFGEKKENVMLIAGVLAIESQHIITRNPNASYANVFWHGLKFTVTVDEEKFNNNLFLFAKVLEQLFPLYMSATNFSQLEIINQQDKRLYLGCEWAGEKGLV